MVFGECFGFGVAEDCGCGGEDEGIDVMFEHGVEEVDGIADVVGVVF